LTTPVSKLIKNPQAITAKLSRLGIFSVLDLITHYPRDYEDRSKVVPLIDYQKSAVNTQVKVIAREFIGFGKTRAMKVYIEDESSVKSNLNALDLL